MNVQILLFGITTDLLGTSSIYFEVPENATVSKLKQELVTLYSQLEHIDSYAIAVNESYANDETVLNNGDIIAVIPPVSGG